MTSMFFDEGWISSGRRRSDISFNGFCRCGSARRVKLWLKQLCQPPVQLAVTHMSSVVYVARRSYYQLDQRTGTRPPHMTGVLGTQRKIGRGSPQTARKKAYRCARPDTQSSQQIRQCLCKVNLAIRPQAYRTAI